MRRRRSNHIYVLAPLDEKRRELESPASFPAGRKSDPCGFRFTSSHRGGKSVGKLAMMG
jgi:hypothetical protein